VQDLMADLGMLLDDLELLGGEPAGFSQDGVGDAEQRPAGPVRLACSAATIASTSAAAALP